MKAESDGRFVGTLPKPKPGLGTFRYVIDAVDEAAAGRRTEELEVAVADDPKGCPAPPVAAARSVVVEVPAGARARPPVPQGFSGSGVKGEGGSQVGVFYMPPRLAAAVGVTLVTGGAAAAAVALFDHPPSDLPPRPPQLVVVRSEPPVGSTLSLSRDRLTLSLRVTLRRAVGAGTVTLALAPNTGFCLLRFVGGHGPIPAETPVELTMGGGPDCLPLPGGFHRRRAAPDRRRLRGDREHADDRVPHHLYRRALNLPRVSSGSEATPASLGRRLVRHGFGAPGLQVPSSLPSALSHRLSLERSVPPATLLVLQLESCDQCAITVLEEQRSRRPCLRRVHRDVALPQGQDAGDLDTVNRAHARALEVISQAL
jgi:hypothetical protein